MLTFGAGEPFQVIYDAAERLRPSLNVRIEFCPDAEMKDDDPSKNLEPWLVHFRQMEPDSDKYDYLVKLNRDQPLEELLTAFVGVMSYCVMTPKPWADTEGPEQDIGAVALLMSMDDMGIQTEKENDIPKELYALAVKRFPILGGVSA